MEHSETVAPVQLLELRLRRGAELDAGSSSSPSATQRSQQTLSPIISRSVAVALAQLDDEAFIRHADVRRRRTAEWFGQGAIDLPRGSIAAALLVSTPNASSAASSVATAAPSAAERRHSALVATSFVDLETTSPGTLRELAAFAERGDAPGDRVAAALASNPDAVRRLVLHVAERSDERSAAARGVLRACGWRDVTGAGAETLRELVPVLARPSANKRLELATLGARLIATPSPHRSQLHHERGESSSLAAARDDVNGDGVSPGSSLDYSVQVHHPFHTVCHQLLLGRAPSTVPVVWEENNPSGGVHSVAPELVSITSTLAASSSQSESHTSRPARNAASDAADRRLSFVRAVVRQCRGVASASYGSIDGSTDGSTTREMEADGDSSTTDSEWSADEDEHETHRATAAPSARRGGPRRNNDSSASAAGELDRPWHIPILEIGHADADETRRQHERMRQRASLGHMEVSFRPFSSAAAGLAGSSDRAVREAAEATPNERSASAVANLRRRVQRESHVRRRNSPSRLSRRQRSSVHISVGDRVRCIADLRRAMQLAQDHGGWVPVMERFLDKIGSVVSITPLGDLCVQFDASVSTTMLRWNTLTFVKMASNGIDSGGGCGANGASSVMMGVEGPLRSVATIGPHVPSAQRLAASATNTRVSNSLSAEEKERAHLLQELRGIAFNAHRGEDGFLPDSSSGFTLQVERGGRNAPGLLPPSDARVGDDDALRVEGTEKMPPLVTPFDDLYESIRQQVRIYLISFEHITEFFTNLML